MHFPARPCRSASVLPSTGEWSCRHHAQSGPPTPTPPHHPHWLLRARRQYRADYKKTCDVMLSGGRRSPSDLLLSSMAVNYWHHKDVFAGLWCWWGGGRSTYLAVCPHNQPQQPCIPLTTARLWHLNGSVVNESRRISAFSCWANW